MLTIKHISETGNEQIVECHTFIREGRYDGFTQFLAYGERPEPNDYIATWCGDENARFGPNNPGSYQRIYVMNRSGSTVATYSFAKPDFSAVRDGEMQAAPEAVVG